jgi:hypothetical protein
VGVEFLGRNTNLGTESELPVVREAGGGIMKHSGSGFFGCFK